MSNIISYAIEAYGARCVVEIAKYNDDSERNVADGEHDEDNKKHDGHLPTLGQLLLLDQILSNHCRPLL